MKPWLADPTMAGVVAAKLKLKKQQQEEEEAKNKFDPNWSEEEKAAYYKRKERKIFKVWCLESGNLVFTSLNLSLQSSIHWVFLVGHCPEATRSPQTEHERPSSRARSSFLPQHIHSLVRTSCCLR